MANSSSSGLAFAMVAVSILPLMFHGAENADELDDVIQNLMVIEAPDWG